jgi:hypothetical protein
MASSLRTAFAGVSLALVASIGLHVVRWSRDAGERVTSPATSTTIATTPVVATAMTSGAPIDLPTCSVQLAACREESWNVVAKSISADVAGQRTKPRAGETAADPAPPTTPADQHRVLCDIAEQQAREHWVKNRTSILASAKDIGKPEWIRSERKKELDGIESLFGANPAERQRFDRGYDTLWAKYGALLRGQLDREPLDLGPVMDTVRAIFRDEDALVESVLGAHARDEYRAAEMRSRTAIVAILAALADRPFDDTLAW